MKSIGLTSLLASSLFTAAAFAPAQAQVQRFGNNPFLPPAATLHYARDRDYHVSHLKLVFDIDAANHSARGVVTHTLAPLRDHLDQIVMDAGANLQIEECRIDGTVAPFKRTGDLLTVTAAAPLARGKEVTLTIRYVMPGGKVGGGANGSGGFKWIDPNPADPGRKPGFWTQGETDTNHSWVPCYDYPNDKCTSETIVTVPEGWSVIGNGTEGKTTSNPAKHTRTFRWTMTQPHSTYLLSLLGGELDIKKDVWKGVPLYYVVPKGRANLIDGSFGNTPDMLEFFSNKFGVKYAWPKYAESAVYDFPGGMENVSATTLGVYALTDRRSGKYPMSSLNSHELAHQWFGDLATCKDWGDIWLNESFATFCEMIYMEHLDGKDRYDEEKESNLQQYLGESRRYKRPLSTKLYANADAMFDAHTYPKGGLILHMLRHQLGDTDLFRGLKHYLTVNRYQPVDAHDLEKALTEETGHNVEPFFDQWIFKPGHPVLDMTWNYDEAGKAVVVHVKQLQDTSDGTPVYNTPLTLGLIHNGAATTSGNANAALERKQVTLDKADQEFRFPVTDAPETVLLDPDHDLLKEVKENHWTDAQTPAILRYAPCYLDRRRAARQFITSDAATPEAKTKLFVDVLKSETSEAVSALLLTELGDLKDPALRPIFRENAKSKQPGRRAAALVALGKLPRTGEDVTLLKSFAGSDTEPYIVVENALAALGQLDAAGSLETFRHQMRSKSMRDRLARKAMDTLIDAKVDAAAPLIIEASDAAYPPALRENAIIGLSKIAPGDPTIHTKLVALLNDSQPRVQKAAVRALKDRNDKTAADALRELAAHTKDQDIKQAADDAATDLSK